MASGISAKLPLDQKFGLNKTIRGTVAQNLKMILLTSPGERTAMPEFGVGMRRFLFEPLTRNTLSSIESKIREQVKRYLPAIKIEKIFIDSVLDNPDLIRFGDNYIQLSLNYTILPIGANVLFNLEVTDTSIIIDSPNQPEL